MYKEIELRITPEEAHYSTESWCSSGSGGTEGTGIYSPIPGCFVCRDGGRGGCRTGRFVCGFTLDRVGEKTDSFGEREMRGRAETGSESFVQNRGGE